VTTAMNALRAAAILAAGILIALMVTGCHGGPQPSPDAQPAPPVGTTPPGPAAVCLPYPADLSVNVEQSGAYGEFTSKRAFSGMEVWSEDGAVKRGWDGLNATFATTAPTALPAAPGPSPRQYKVRITIAGCVSNWQAFTVTPNPDVESTLPVSTPPPRTGPPSGPPVVITPHIPQERPWGPEVCVWHTDNKHAAFNPGVSHTFAVSAQTEVRARYGDPNHTPTYQTGQLEIINLGFGRTDDLPDAATEAVKEFRLAAPVGSITAVGEAGSVFWLCLSGR